MHLENIHFLNELQKFGNVFYESLSNQDVFSFTRAHSRQIHATAACICLSAANSCLIVVSIDFSPPDYDPMELASHDQQGFSSDSSRISTAFSTALLLTATAMLA